MKTLSNRVLPPFPVFNTIQDSLLFSIFSSTIDLMELLSAFKNYVAAAAVLLFIPGLFIVCYFHHQKMEEGSIDIVAPLDWYIQNMVPSIGKISRPFLGQTHRFLCWLSFVEG